MQGEKEMKGKVSTPCWDRRGRGGGHTDILTDGLSDQATRLLEFHCYMELKTEKDEVKGGYYGAPRSRVSEH